MPSELTWVDHNRKARERTLRILAYFQEKRTRDELGLGGITSSLSDILFPGTTTIQTRLRYVFFVPWIYLSLEEKYVPAKKFGNEADKLERNLVKSLSNSSDTKGIIGKIAKKGLKRLPSSIYWRCFAVWGLFRRPISQAEYHRRIEDIYSLRRRGKRIETRAKDLGDDLDYEPRLDSITWRTGLPPAPADFPEKAEFALTYGEAQFIQDRLKDRCPDSLLTFLALNPTQVFADVPWEHPDLGSFSNEHQELLDHGRLFSEVMGGAMISYNVQLAELIGGNALIAEHLSDFDDWLAKLPHRDLKAWQVKRFWELIKHPNHTISIQTKIFVETWINKAITSPKTLLSDQQALDLVKLREISLKGIRSRFTNRLAREQWNSSSGQKYYRYRWETVRDLINDLYHGIKR